MNEPRIVLQLERTIGVLVCGVPAGRPAHDAAATAALRQATGCHDISIVRRPSGRPALAPPYPELSVSLSWREGLLLVTFDPQRIVGADIEPADAGRNLDPVRLAADHFSAAEAAAVKALPADAAADLFLRLWVAKEAALKLGGRGVFDGLAEPDLSTHIAALQQESSPVTLGAGSHLPALQLLVTRPLVPGLSGAPFCAVARVTAD